MGNQNKVGSCLLWEACHLFWLRRGPLLRFKFILGNFSHYICQILWSASFDKPLPTNQIRPDYTNWARGGWLCCSINTTALCWMTYVQFTSSGNSPKHHCPLLKATAQTPPGSSGSMEGNQTVFPSSAPCGWWARQQSKLNKDMREWGRKEKREVSFSVGMSPAQPGRRRGRVAWEIEEGPQCIKAEENPGEIKGFLQCMWRSVFLKNC